jgi:uncharacterized membrane protein YbhN (UPF0104 family)
LRLLAQVLVSAVLVGILLSNGILDALATAWDHIGAGDLALACGCFALATLLSSRRWQVLLRAHGIREPLPRLVELYWVGLFCSLFLPTSAGGDAYRVFAIARRGRPAASVLLATLQERLLGLGATMLVGFGAALWFHEQLPAGLLASVLALFAAGVLAVVAVLYLGTVLRVARRLPGRWRLPRRGPLLRVVGFLRPLREAPPLGARVALHLLGLALGTFVAAVGMYAAVCAALGAHCGWLELSLVVAVVGVVRMLPVSLNGIGVGEGAFVGMMTLFAVPAEKSGPAAVVLLGVTLLMSLSGGAFLVARVFLGEECAQPTPRPTASEPAVLPLPEPVPARGDVVHAA